MRTHVERLLTALLAATIAGCASKPDPVARYQVAAGASEREQRGVDAEGYHRSAVERARVLGPAKQSEALLGLGAFLQRELRFRDSLAPLNESLVMARAANLGTTEVALRRVHLAKSYGALNRWQDGAAELRAAMPDARSLDGDAGKLAREVIDVYRVRLPALLIDATFLD
ncbi:MAG: hypothetical protein ABI794_03005 [Betaproteobacteria bacterium]